MNDSVIKHDLPKQPIPPRVKKTSEGIVCISIYACIFVIVASLICSYIYRERIHSEDLSYFESKKGETIELLKSLGYKAFNDGTIELPLHIYVERNDKAENIGNSLIFSFSINEINRDSTFLVGGRVDKEDKIRLNIFDNNLIQTEIVEGDEEYPDVGKCKNKFKLDVTELNTGVSITGIVRIYETNGKWEGNTDIYNVTYILRNPEGIRLNPVDKNRIQSGTQKPNYPTFSVLNCLKNSAVTRLIISGIIVITIIICVIYKFNVDKYNSKEIIRYHMQVSEYAKQIERYEKEQTKWEWYDDYMELKEKYKNR